LLLDELSDAEPILKCLPRDFDAESSVELLLGPEGGWTDGEHESAIARGWRPCSLGSTILRAETAAIAGISVVMAAAAAASGR
jgi:16S rRNA (uracil1498-N3)-methyltransferase